VFDTVSEALLAIGIAGLIAAAAAVGGLHLMQMDEAQACNGHDCC
jgi:hypothetical protein